MHICIINGRDFSILRIEARVNFLKRLVNRERRGIHYHGRAFPKIFLALVAVFIFSGFIRFGTSHAAMLTIACYEDYRPYSYVNDKGQVVGMLVDFWTLWAEKNQIELTFLPGPLTRAPHPGPGPD